MEILPIFNEGGGIESCDGEVESDAPDVVEREGEESNCIDGGRFCDTSTMLRAAG